MTETPGEFGEFHGQKLDCKEQKDENKEQQQQHQQQQQQRNLNLEEQKPSNGLAPIVATIETVDALFLPCDLSKFFCFCFCF